MSQWLSRTELLLGKEAIQKLSASRVAVFGIGGVGGYACEALVRSGVGAFDLIDSDKISESNLNRQIIATRRTLGRYKTEVMKERILDINPDASVRIYNCFFLSDNAEGFPFEEYDYIIDAVDTVTAKIELVVRARLHGVPIISSMGAGNKLNADKFQIVDIYQTKVCPLARVMRTQLKKRGIDSLKVVYSEEKPIIPLNNISDSGEAYTLKELENENCPAPRRTTPGSTAFVPSVAGLIIAGEAVKDLCGLK